MGPFLPTKVAPIFGPRYVAKLVRSTPVLWGDGDPAPHQAGAWLLAIFGKLTATWHTRVFQQSVRGCSLVPPPISASKISRVTCAGFSTVSWLPPAGVPIGPQLGCWGATEQKARLSRGPHACQARFRRNPLENPLHPHSDRMKCGKHGPFLAARTMNPSVNFPKSKLNGSVRPQNLNYEARTFSWWGHRIRSRPTNRYATQF